MAHSTELTTTIANKLNYINDHFPESFKDTPLYKVMMSYFKILGSSYMIDSTPESILYSRLDVLDDLITKTTVEHLNNYQSND